jgi:hypothetical protein
MLLTTTMGVIEISKHSIKALTEIGAFPFRRAGRDRARTDDDDLFKLAAS